MRLISNGFEYQVNVDEASLYYSHKFHPLAKKVSVEKYYKILNGISANDKTLVLESGNEHIYYSFLPLGVDDKELRIKLTNATIRKEFVKCQLYAILKDYFIIDFTKLGSDLTLYRKNAISKWPNWDSYTSYNLIIRNREIHLSIASRNTLISREALPNFSFNGQPAYKALLDGHIYHKDVLPEDSYRCVASREIRISQNLIAKPQLPNYPDYFIEIKRIYEEIIKLNFETISISKAGFNVLQEGKDYSSVTGAYNVMLFKHNQTNVNASNGMKNDGPYAPPNIDLSNLEFVFIYPSSSREKMKELYMDFRNGKTSYFTGLERFVNIPIKQPTSEFILKYDSQQYNDLPQLVQAHIQGIRTKMPDKPLFALVLLPKSKKDENDFEQAEYFELKKVLLSNDVASQFIDERAIGSENFIYWLPNLAIAIQAKLGGIPWKLNRAANKDLVIGFGDASRNSNNYIGSTVFFDNSGRLKASNYFQQADIVSFKQTIKTAILNFIQEMAQKPERLVIHYYKIPGNKEKDAIYDALAEIGLGIPYVIVTIHDAKAKDFIAFDESFGYGMPMSGTSWRINKGEYVLFNNTRYEEKPRSGKPIKQEYPIKLRIWSSSEQLTNEEQIKRVIGQVFEFSRIYWKSVQQQSKPVTAMYPAMIAEFGSHFENGAIPNCRITQQTPWFI